MDKAKALSLFGGPAKTAAAVGVSTSAISQWPEQLPPHLVDRVIAAAARRDSPSLVARVTGQRLKALGKRKAKAEA